MGRETAALVRDATVTTQAEPQVLPTPPWTVLGLGEEGHSKSLGLGLTWGSKSLANSCFLFAKVHNLYFGIKKTDKNVQLLSQIGGFSPPPRGGLAS